MASDDGHPARARWGAIMKTLPGDGIRLVYDAALGKFVRGVELQPPRRPAKRRQFRRLDETWAEKLLTSNPLVSRGALLLALVLLAEADFHERIKVTAEVTKVARLTRFRKRAALRDLERLGLIAVEWRGNGRAPIVIPLNLSRRPGRK
jgi:hypothetical protein